MSEAILQKVFTKYAATDIETALEAGQAINDEDFFYEFFSKNEGSKLLPKYIDKLPQAFTDKNRLKLFKLRPNLFSTVIDKFDLDQIKGVFDVLKETGDDEMSLADIRFLVTNSFTDSLKLLESGEGVYHVLIDSLIKLLPTASDGETKVEFSPDQKKIIESVIGSKYYDTIMMDGAPDSIQRFLGAYLDAGMEPKKFKILVTDFMSTFTLGAGLFNKIVKAAPVYMPKFTDISADIMDEIYSSKTRATSGPLIAKFYESASDKKEFISRLQGSISGCGDDSTDYRMLVPMSAEHIGDMLAYCDRYKMDYDELLQEIGPNKFKQALESKTWNTFDLVIAGLTPENVQSLNLDWDKLNLVVDDDWTGLQRFYNFYEESGEAAWVKALAPKLFGETAPKGMRSALDNSIIDSYDEFGKYLDLYGVTEEEVILEYPEASIDNDYLIDAHPELVAKLIKQIGDTPDPKSSVMRMLVEVARKSELVRKKLLDAYGLEPLLDSLHVDAAFAFIEQEAKNGKDIELSSEAWLKLAKNSAKVPVEKIAYILNEMGEDAAIFETSPNHEIVDLAKFIAAPNKATIRDVNERVNKLIDLVRSDRLTMMLGAEDANARAVAINKLLNRKVEIDRDSLLIYLEDIVELKQVGDYNKGTVARVLSIPSLKVPSTTMRKLAATGLLPRFKKAIDKESMLPQDVISDEKLDLLHLLLPLAR